jgi:hypothetical protein
MEKQMHTVKFKSTSYDDDRKTVIADTAASWEDQSTMFLAFLKGQGFKVSAGSLANHYGELADEDPTVVYGDLIVTGVIRAGGDVVAFDPEAEATE